MNHKLKYLKLFEGLTPKEIPYSKVDADGKLDIKIPIEVKDLPSEYNQITDEITGDLIIEDTKSLTNITNFDNLISIGDGIYIKSNPSLIEIVGFDSLIEVGLYISITHNQSLIKIVGFGNLKVFNRNLYIDKNPKLVTMSIPGNLIRAVNYINGCGIVYNNILKFKSPSEFINSPDIIEDLVRKFNPGDHGDLVVKQIIENIEEWGTEETKTKVYSFLGEHATPEQWTLVPDRINHRYNPSYIGATGRDVAKVNSGEVYGIF